jgi:hypothetical protein
MSSGVLSYKSAQTLTCTSFNSLGNGAGAQTAAIDGGLVTEGYPIDWLILIKLVMSANTPADAVLLYVAGLVDSTPTYTDGATGADAAFTIANRLNAPLLTTHAMRNGNTTQDAVWLSSVQKFRRPPQKFSLIGENKTGFTLGTGHSLVAVPLILTVG